MRVVVVCFGRMREYLPSAEGGNRVELEVPEIATLGDAIDALGAPRSEVFAALVDGRRAGVDEGLSEGCEVTLMPPFTGGAN